jgi:hypothetical protein
MPQLYGFKVGGFHASAFPAVLPCGLCSGSSIQWMPPSGSSFRCSSSRTSILSTYLGASIPSTLHLIWKLQLGQRFCVLCLFVSLVSLLFVLLLPRRTPSSKAICSTSAIIRFSSNQHMVPAVHPGCQSSQACIVPASDDGCSGPCLLNWISKDHNTLLHDVYLFFHSKSHDQTISFRDLLYGVGANQDLPAFTK